MVLVSIFNGLQRFMTLFLRLLGFIVSRKVGPRKLFGVTVVVILVAALIVLLDNIVEYVISGQTTVLGDSKGYYFGTPTSNPGYSGN